MGTVEESIGGLYSGPLEEFTPARNELASELRAGGDAETADRVKGLKKPTRAAWLVNQLSTRKPAETKKLLVLGSELRELQEKLLGGEVDRDKLRDAAQREQRAVEGLVNAAEAIGAEHDVGSQILDRVTETLQAASSDPELADRIEHGRVEREQRATSLGLVGPAGTAPRPKGKSKKDDDEADNRRAEAEGARRRRAVKKRVASAEKSAERARGKVERARDELGQLEDALRDAEAELAEAKDELKGL